MLPASQRMKPSPPLWPAPAEPDPMCVCTHRFSEHRPTEASAPLPTYKIIGGDGHLHSESANYTQTLCSCGCTLPEHDHCRYQITVDTTDDEGFTVREVTRTCRLDHGHRGDHLP